MQEYARPEHLTSLLPLQKIMEEASYVVKTLAGLAHFGD